MEETLGGLEELKKEGLVRNIGVSNFTVAHLENALEKSTADIANNQVRIHPYEYPDDVIEYCQEKNITVTAYSPLARGKIFDDKELTALSKKYDRSPSQLVLKWLVEKNILVIPKATTLEHIKDNMDIFSWRLPEEVREKLDKKGEMSVEKSY